MRSRFFLFLALVAALGAAAVFYFFLQHLQETYRKQAQYVSVVTAAVDLPARTLLVPAMLKQVDVPAAGLHPQAVRRLDQAVGQITRTPLVAGEVLLASKLASDKDEQRELALGLKEGERALTLGVDTVTGVGGALRAGDRVDVLGVMDMPDGNFVQVLVANNVRVLGVGKGDKSGDKFYDHVTLAVTPQQAARINLASVKGRLRLVLRNPKDADRIQLAPMRVKDLEGQEGS
ncbi:Flp pilus assembly protein CpaB [Desulfothermobacter acidiphilus]|uniref:Flp pilus assembly protein CpaB n=1 Tax=Desulfothermobacter acidiphilus TaxID=1938353 RepID=UPI003F88C0C6